jgi:mannosyltransferase
MAGPNDADIHARLFASSGLRRRRQTPRIRSLSRPDPGASGARRSRQDGGLSDVEVVIPNFNTRYSGVTSTLIALMPAHASSIGVATIGNDVASSARRLGWRDILLHGWTPPRAHAARIWHSRRNNEMICGIILKWFLRQPWRLVFTRAGLRRPTRLTRFLLRRQDALIATSPEAAAYLDLPCSVIRHGVDLRRYAPAADRAQAWAAAGLPARYGIGIFGRVRFQKGTDQFVAAMLKLLPARPDWMAVIIGLAKPEDAAFVDALRQDIAAAGLSHRILFLGQRPTEEIPLWYRRLSIVVAPPRWEGFGLVPLEAMASGTPVVATRAGAHAALIQDGVTGRLVPADDAAGLTEAVGELMAMSEAERDAMGRAGRTHVESRFSVSGEARSIEAVYARLWGPSA